VAFPAIVRDIEPSFRLMILDFFCMLNGFTNKGYVELISYPCF